MRIAPTDTMKLAATYRYWAAVARLDAADWHPIGPDGRRRVFDAADLSGFADRYEEVADRLAAGLGPYQFGAFRCEEANRIVWDDNIDGAVRQLRNPAARLRPGIYHLFPIDPDGRPTPEFGARIFTVEARRE